MNNFLTLSTHIRVNPRNLWETSTHHRIIEHGCQRYHGWRLRRGSPTDATDYHRFLISARNIRVIRAAIRVLTLCTHIRVNPRNLWETSTYHRIIEHGCQRYHGWKLRRCSPTDATDYHRFFDISTQHPCDSCSNPCSYPLHLHPCKSAQSVGDFYAP